MHIHDRGVVIGRWLLVLGAVAAAAAGGAELSGAVFTSESQNLGNGMTSRNDWTPPTVSAALVVKSAGGTTGFVRPGGRYYLYADATDTGRPASGVKEMDADLSALTSEDAAAPLSAGSYDVGGTAYAYRGGELTVDASLPDGERTYLLRAVDGGGNASQSAAYSVIVDGTPPSAYDVQTVNVTGGAAGKPEEGDQLLLTYSESIEPESILARWSGGATDVVVRMRDGGLENDVVTVSNAAGTAPLPLGAVDLGRSEYVPADRDFGGAGTPSRMILSGGTIVVTLGTPTGPTGTSRLGATMSWAPADQATDRAGNPASAALRREQAALDADF